MKDPKLYIVVRDDIAPGLQCAQAIHAALAWREAHGGPPDNVVVLSAPLAAIASVITRAREDAVRRAHFREADLGNALTAVALGPEGARLVSSLPLALRRAA